MVRFDTHHNANFFFYTLFMAAAISQEWALNNVTHDESLTFIHKSYMEAIEDPKLIPGVGFRQYFLACSGLLIC